MRVAVLGASGKVGRLLTELLLERGHSVTALVHSNKNTLPTHEKLNVISGDVHSPNDITALIKDSDVVVSCLGSWGTKTKDIVSSATINLLPAMEKAGIKRVVSVTGSAAVLPDEKLTLMQSMAHTSLGLVAKPILKDAEKHLSLLAGSNLNWTSVRSPVMTSNSRTTYKLSDKPPAPWATISRKAVVVAIVDLIENDTTHSKALFISAK